MSFQLSELARQFDLELKGQADVVIKSVASLHNAGDGDISFCTGKKHLKELQQTAASAVILHPDASQYFAGNALLADNPYAAYARIASLLHPGPSGRAGIDPTATVHQLAQVDETASIGANVVVEANVEIAAGCNIGAGCYIGENVTVGDHTILKSNVVLHHGTAIGKNCMIHSGSVIGSDGFGHARDGDAWIPIPQLGNVVIGNDVRIGANTAIDRGALDNTMIGDGVKIDNLVHIAHNVMIGEHTAIAALCGVAGSTNIGKRCTFAGQVGVVDNVTICDDAHFTGQSAVRSNITRPGLYSSGVLLEDNRSWSRNAMRFKKLDILYKQVRALAGKQDK